MNDPLDNFMTGVFCVVVTVWCVVQIAEALK